MKALKFAALLLSSSVCVYAQDVTVKGNTKLNTDFSKYKTYSWAQMDVTPSEGDYEIYTYTEEGEVAKPTRTNQVSKKNSRGKNDVKSKGQTKGQTQEPYIYSYSVIIPSQNASVNSTIQNSISQELEGRGYRKGESNSDLLVSYKVLERGAKLRGYVNDSPTVVNGSEVHETQDTTTFFLKPGTLLVNLIDAKNSQVVWDGFASGLIQGSAFTVDPLKLKEAIHLIFEEFKYRADKVEAAK